MREDSAKGKPGSQEGSRKDEGRLEDRQAAA